MMWRILAILLTAGAMVAMWFGYMNLNMFRGTPFFDFRYVIFAISTFLGLSALEWAVGWLKEKVQTLEARD